MITFSPVAGYSGPVTVPAVFPLFHIATLSSLPPAQSIRENPVVGYGSSWSPHSPGINARSEKSKEGHHRRGATLT